MICQSQYAVTSIAIMNVLLTFGALGSFCLITKTADLFTKCVFGWMMGASWALAVILTAVNPQIGVIATMGLFLGIAGAPGFLLGFIVEQLKKKRECYCS